MVFRRFCSGVKGQAGSKASKRLPTWSGPCRITNTSTPHVYQVLNILEGKVSTAHVARMKVYHDSSLALTADMKETIQYLPNQGEFEMKEIGKYGDRRAAIMKDMCTGSEFRKQNDRGNLSRYTSHKLSTLYN